MENEECFGYLKGCGCRDCKDIDYWRDYQENWSSTDHLMTKSVNQIKILFLF